MSNYLKPQYPGFQQISSVLPRAAAALSLLLMTACTSTAPLSEDDQPASVIAGRYGPPRLMRDAGFSQQGMDRPVANLLIPEQMARHIESGLRGLIAPGHVHAVKVELQAAGSNSLDFQIIADFAGPAAEKYQVLRRAVQRLAVSACNEYGWTIAFPQMVVHSAPVTFVNRARRSLQRTLRMGQLLHFPGSAARWPIRLGPEHC